MATAVLEVMNDNNKTAALTSGRFIVMDRLAHVSVINLMNKNLSSFT